MTHEEKMCHGHLQVLEYRMKHYRLSRIPEHLEWAEENLRAIQGYVGFLPPKKRAKIITYASSLVKEYIHV